jgi:pimeloyl-ACP methyl ester carboxylesterase
VRSEHINFYSEGKRLAGVLHLPDGTGPWPVVIQNPGWLELRCSAISERYHEGFVNGGYAVLAYDIRGMGDSEGERGWIRPPDQLEDLLSAIAYARSREECVEDRVGLFALGGVAGGNAMYAAREEPHVKAICAQSVVADGATWFRQMRREHEWVAFKRRVDENRRRRVVENSDELVDPREELMVATPERRTSGVRTSDDVRVGGAFHLSSAEALLRFRPIEVVDRVGCALLITAVEDDVVTPIDHALALYDRAQPPKKLVRQAKVTHYDSYSKNYPVLIAQFLDWFGRYLQDAPITTREQTAEEEIVRI